MRKSTGIVRKVDELGRIVIPIELRRTLSIEEKDSLEIFVDSEGEIILKKYQPGCALCGGMEDLKLTQNNKLVCSKCVEALVKGVAG